MMIKNEVIDGYLPLIAPNMMSDEGYSPLFNGPNPDDDAAGYETAFCYAPPLNTTNTTPTYFNTTIQHDNNNDAIQSIPSQCNQEYESTPPNEICDC